jgi:hypothetical protein
VRYDEFRNSLLLALREADLYSSWDRLTETIDLDTMSRTWKSSFGSGPKKEVEPFHVYGMASFRWDPLDSARTHTTEEDVVTELFGRDDELPETMQRTLRTDIVLHAKLPLDSSTLMPDGKLWRSWSARVDERLSPFLPREVARLRGDPVIAMGMARNGRSRVSVLPRRRAPADRCFRPRVAHARPSSDTRRR